MADNKFSRSQSLMASCVPMTKLQSVIGGKWKIPIICALKTGESTRYNELNCSVIWKESMYGRLKGKKSRSY